MGHSNQVRHDIAGKGGSSGWLGASIGPWFVTDKRKPGKRTIYTLTYAYGGIKKHMSGRKLVEFAKAARSAGWAVVMGPGGYPWRDET